MSRPLRLDIAELHLEGLPIADPRALAPIIEQELAALVSAVAPDQPLRRVVHSPTITLSPREGAQAAGRKIAEAIYQSIVPPSNRGRR